MYIDKSGERTDDFLETRSAPPSYSPIVLKISDLTLSYLLVIEYNLHTFLKGIQERLF